MTVAPFTPPDFENRAPHRLSYRPHIDGLRAVAVLGVVLYHFNWPWIPGGYVGVDVFFVISGFLIARQIEREMDAECFSLVGFYERRARRILPAFVVVTLLVLLCGRFLLMPHALISTAKAAIAAATFTANAYYFNAVDYFFADADITPLLHTWSLSIEEQFYLLFPLLLLTLAEFKVVRIKTTLTVLLVLSLIACEATRRTDPGAAFYLLPFRAFELLIGCLLAHIEFPAEPRNGWATLLALTGLTGIAAAMALLTKRSPFPGVATLLPCIGAGLVIAAGELGKSPVLRLLGNPAARFVGRISYSLYLIHWPVYVFAGLWFAGHGAWFIHESPAFRVGGPLAAVVLAAVLYRFVEQPPRRNRRLFTRTVVFTMSGLALLLVIAGAAVTIRAKGWPERYSGRMQTLLAQKESPNPIEHVRWGTCFFAWADYRIDLSSETCFPKGRRTVLLWGDSTMAHFYFGLEPLFRTIGYQTAETTVGACAPIPGDAETPAPDGCRALQRQILDLTLERRPELVILGAYWDLTPERTRELLDLVARLRANGSAVLVLGNSRRLVARGPFIVISRITGDLALPDDARLVYSQPELDAADAALKHALNERFAGDSGVMFIEPARLFFTDNLRIAGGDEPYFIDFVHFSRAGSAYYGKLLFDELMTMWTPEDKPPLPPGESAGSTPPAPP